MAELDLDTLAEEFGISGRTDNRTEIIKIDVDKYIDEIDISDPDIILKKNLAKANAILDKVISELNSGNFTARMIEVSSMIMSIVSGMTTQLYRKINDEKTLQFRQNVLELKTKMAKIGEHTTNNNIIVTDRETVLRLLKDEQSKKLIENKESNN